MDRFEGRKGENDAIVFIIVLKRKRYRSIKKVLMLMLIVIRITTKPNSSQDSLT